MGKQSMNLVKTLPTQNRACQELLKSGHKGKSEIVIHEIFYLRTKENGRRDVNFYKQQSITMFCILAAHIKY